MRLWSKRDEDAPKQSKKATWPAWRPLLLGALVTAALIYGLGYWANQAMISGAVIASGELRVETRRKVVSHFDGGVVAEIAVREGDTVEAGDLLLQLDATELAADLEILEAEHDALLARQARLTAERDEQRDIEIAPVLAERLRSRPQLENAIAGQRRLFKARRNTHLQQQAQFRVRNEQLQNQISGGRAQIAALDDQLQLIKEEIADQTSLLDRGLTPKKPASRRCCETRPDFWASGARAWPKTRGCGGKSAKRSCGASNSWRSAGKPQSKSSAQTRNAVAP